MTTSRMPVVPIVTILIALGCITIDLPIVAMIVSVVGVVIDGKNHARFAAAKKASELDAEAPPHVALGGTD